LLMAGTDSRKPCSCADTESMIGRIRHSPPTTTTSTDATDARLVHGNGDGTMLKQGLTINVAYELFDIPDRRD
jgi:hypothetical protein